MPGAGTPRSPPTIAQRLRRLSGNDPDSLEAPGDAEARGG
jgi:hypothetical protein